jgi:hypothetical protein
MAYKVYNKRYLWMAKDEMNNNNYFIQNSNTAPDMHMTSSLSCVVHRYI